MSNGWLRAPLGTSWPDPADPLSVEWALRYGTPTREQQLWAASVIAAYKHLLESPVSQSRRDLSMLRREIKGGGQDG